MQVRDSKKISDGRILELAPDIRLLCPHSLVAIGPQRYNELYAKIKNLNRLLAWGHARALENLLQQVECDLAIADQFGDERLILNALQVKENRSGWFNVRKRNPTWLWQRPQSWLGRSFFSASIDSLKS